MKTYEYVYATHGRVLYVFKYNIVIISNNRDDLPSSIKNKYIVCFTNNFTKFRVFFLFTFFKVVFTVRFYYLTLDIFLFSICYYDTIIIGGSKKKT